MQADAFAPGSGGVGPLSPPVRIRTPRLTEVSSGARAFSESHQLHRQSNDSGGERRQHHGYGRRNHRLPPIHRSRIHRASAFLPASLIRRRAMVGAPRLPGTRTLSVSQPAARQSTKRRDTAAMPQHKRHRVAIRRVGEQLERFPLTGREDHESEAYQRCVAPPSPPSDRSIKVL
jgi:hypothetical protein